MNTDTSTAMESRGSVKRVIGRHWKTLLLPLAATVAALALGMIPYSWKFGWIGQAFGYLWIGGLLWFLMLAIARFYRKRIGGGFAALGCMIAAVISIVPVYLISGFLGLAIPSDGFADDLSVPEGVELAEPLERDSFREMPGGPADVFQAAVRAALEVPGSEDSRVNLRVSSLERVRLEKPALLERYLAVHPGWRVYEERGRRFATRRWMNGSNWRVTLHGYYSWFSDDGPRYQTRTSLCLSGKPWGRNGQRIEPGKLGAVDLRRGNNLHESSLIVPAGDLLIEQFEQSDARERRITKAVFAELEREFAALEACPDWEAAKSLLPVDAVVRGEPSLVLHRYQGGIYNVEVRCNPGEPGRVFLKAFEITRNHPLSVDRLQTSTNEWMGWSGDPTEQFFSETHFTIYEGDWEQYYGARFEVWFESDKGSAARKLLERDFRIEGWMH
jgi:hypothetical protein